VGVGVPSLVLINHDAVWLRFSTFFNFIFGEWERLVVAEAVGQDLNPAYENRKSATYDAGEEHHLEDVGCEENEFVQYQIQGEDCSNCQE
jgi:hypothetical protein